MPRPVKVQRAEKLRRLTSREDTEAVVTSVGLPRDLHKRTAVAALDLNWSMAELFRVAVREWLDRHDVARRSGGRP